MSKKLRLIESTEMFDILMHILHTLETFQKVNRVILVLLYI